MAATLGILCDMRWILRWALGGAAAAVAAALFEPPVVRLLERTGYYDATQSPSIAVNYLERILGVEAFPWVAGITIGLFIGVWIDRLLKKREQKGTWILPTNVNAEVKNALEKIYTHMGELGGYDYISNARATINAHMADYINEPDTQSILKAIVEGCYAVENLQNNSMPEADQRRLISTIKECCYLLLNNFNKRPSRRDAACRDFIRKKKELLPQEPTNTEEGRPQ